MRPTVITPPGRLALPPWRELWEAREVALRFAQRDIVLRYRQTFIGVAWVLVQPLAAAGIFAIIFGAVAQLPTGGTRALPHLDRQPSPARADHRPDGADLSSRR